MRSINTELDRKFRETVGFALMARPKGDSSCTPTVAFANACLFTVDATWFSDWPGAAHSSNGWTTTTYDLPTGEPLDWTRTVHFPAVGPETFDFAKGNDVVSLALRHAADERNDNECVNEAFRSFECDGSRCRNQGAKNMADWKWPLVLSPGKEGLFAAFNEYSEGRKKLPGRRRDLDVARRSRAFARAEHAAMNVSRGVGRSPELAHVRLLARPSSTSCCIRSERTFDRPE
ncbi:hypothetical protein [Burkholderia ubonensis]|uniref:hypothetical protein n=1 Tax=Burkholderia ubonensis TaxID=101571 RepID=UPI0010558CD3|nr:hypothetical protein [Burkholderia ubonensis]